jgi:uncharacterized repeat protein (TIGR02543 family)
MVLHAQWTANTLAVTYDTQGGSAVNAGSTKTDEAISTDPGTPARDGHTFNGWFSNSTGGNPLTFPHTHGKTAAFTIYAQWTPLPASTSTTTSSTSTSSTTTSSTSTSSTTTTVLEPVIAEQQSKDLPVTGTNPWPVASLALLALSFGFVVLHRQRRY